MVAYVRLIAANTAIDTSDRGCLPTKGTAELAQHDPTVADRSAAAMTALLTLIQTAMKAIVIADWRGRTLWTDALRPGRMHDATAARNEGIAICFQHFPDVEVLLDDGYLGLSRNHHGQAITPPRKPRPGAPPSRVKQWEQDRHRHSSDRITVEHALADHKRWKQLQRWTHRRDRPPDTGCE